MMIDRKSLAQLAVILTIALAPVAVIFYVHARQSSRLTYELRRDYLNDDFERGVAAGQSYLKYHRGSLDQLAWLALNSERAGDSPTAIQLAQSIRQRAPGSPWAQFALAGALIYDDTKENLALQSSRAAFVADPANENFAWMYLETLRLRHRFDEARALIKQHQGEFQNSSLVQSSIATMMFDEAQSAGFPDNLMKAALNVAAHAEALDPHNVKAFYVPALFLMQADRPDVARHYFVRATRETTSPRIWAGYWESIADSPGLPMAAKRDRILADVADLRLTHKLDSSLLRTAAVALDSLGFGSASKKIADELINSFPDSLDAGDEMLGRLQAAVPLNQGRPASNAATRAALERLAQRRPFVGTRVQSGAGVQLLQLMRFDPAPSPDELRSAVRYVIPASGSNSLLLASASNALARHGVDLSYAAKLVSDGFKNLPAYSRQFGSTAGEQQSVARSVAAQLLTTRGIIDFQQGKMAESKQQLQTALRAEPDIPDALYYLAEIARKGGDVAAARSDYAACAAVAVESTCDDAAQRIFHVASERDILLWKRDVDNARARTLLAVRKTAHSPMEFRLTLASGGTITSEALRGKPVLLIFWSVNCHVCRSELPSVNHWAQIQKDAAQVILVDTSPMYSLSKSWLVSQQISLRNTRAPDLARRLNVVAVPTFVFLDSTVRETFRMDGAGRDLTQDLDEMLRLVRSPSRVQ